LFFYVRANVADAASRISVDGAPPAARASLSRTSLLDHLTLYMIVVINIYMMVIISKTRGNGCL
jgi:hypothetical protein